MLRSFFPCECTEHTLSVMYDKGVDQYYVAILAVHNSEYSFSRRLKYLWKMLTQGVIYADQIVLSRASAERLANIIIAEEVIKRDNA